jgi:putative flippase GtrA
LLASGGVSPAVLAGALVERRRGGLAPLAERANEWAAAMAAAPNIDPADDTTGAHREMLKAVSFASIGVVNAGVNALVFWLVLRLLGAVGGLAEAVGRAAALCGCMSAETAGVILANLLAWAVAVTGSYVMNAHITFAAESGRRLTLPAYAAFAGSGVLGLIAETGALLAAKPLMPIMLAKLMGIAAGFVVNFSMSRLFVFRPRPADGDGQGPERG